MKSLYYNYFYYKNYLTCKLFPNYIANYITDLFFTPRLLPQQPYEAEFEQKTKHNIIKIPTEGYKERAAKFEEYNKERKDMKLNRVPELPSEINVLEFLPEDNTKPIKPATIVCVHGWEGRGTNFFKFIPKLTKKGFRVLAPDFPMHGNTGGTETGCHVFGFALNCILNYIKTPVILLVHSLGNGATCTNYYISDDETRNQIKGFVGIGVPDTFEDYIKKFGTSVGLDDYTNNLFLDKNSEKYFNYPCLIVHDEKDKEVKIEWAINSSKFIPQKFQTYKIGDKEYPCLYKTSGLGHRRIMRDDKVVEVVVDFIDNIQF